MSAAPWRAAMGTVGQLSRPRTTRSAASPCHRFAPGPPVRHPRAAAPRQPRRRPGASRRQCAHPTTRCAPRCRARRRQGRRGGPTYQAHSNHPMVVGSREGSSAAHGCTASTGSASSAMTYPTASLGSSATFSMSSSPIARRTAVFVEPSHHTMSASVPGPNARSHASTRNRTLSACAGRSNSLPSQSSIRVQQGRDVRHGPSLVARTIRPSAGCARFTPRPAAAAVGVGG